MADAQLQKNLFGMPDSRGPQGIMSRGKNVYNGASHAAHSGGGPQFGRPKENPGQDANSTVSVFERALQQQEGPVDMSPQPINPLMGAIQRRLSGGQR